MPLTTRRAFGNINGVTTRKNAAAAVNNLPGKQAVVAHQDLKRTLVTGSSPKQILAKRQHIDKENLVQQTDAVQKKIENIKLSESKSVPAEQPQQLQTVKATKTRTSRKLKTWRDCYHTPEDLPTNVVDYDKSQLTIADSEPVYAYDIFQYLKRKEVEMQTQKYMSNQKNLTEKMRAVLIDWLVEVQQSFELFHETLYLAVKYVDHYLMKKTITRERFQLLGLTAVFVACKFEERCFPVVDDFIYMSDDSYTRDEFFKMEIDLLSTLKFDVNFPLSYSFLRRFARCGSVPCKTLTLARYILESSLLDYSFVDELDSKIAAASLLLAFRMQQEPDDQWSPTLTYYSGYKQSDLEQLVVKLNKLITNSAKSNSRLKTVHSKYSDSVFQEVALISPLRL